MDGVLDISIVWVHEDYRGEGYGRQLMATVEAEGRQLVDHDDEKIGLGHGRWIPPLRSYRPQAGPAFCLLAIRPYVKFDAPTTQAPEHCGRSSSILDTPRPARAPSRPFFVTIASLWAGWDSMFRVSARASMEPIMPWSTC